MCIIYSNGKSAVRFHLASESDNFSIERDNPFRPLSPFLPGGRHGRANVGRELPADPVLQKSSLPVLRVTRSSLETGTSAWFSIPSSRYRFSYHGRCLSISPLSFDPRTELYYPGDAAIHTRAQLVPVARRQSRRRHHHHHRHRYRVHDRFLRNWGRVPSVQALPFESLPLRINTLPIMPASHPQIRFPSGFFSFSPSSRGSHESRRKEDKENR